MRFPKMLLTLRRHSVPDRPFDVVVFHDHIVIGQTVSRFYFVEELPENGWRNHVLPALMHLPGIVCGPEALEPHAHYISVQWAMNPLMRLGYSPLEAIEKIEQLTLDALVTCFGWRHDVRLQCAFSNAAVQEISKELNVMWEATEVQS